MKVTITIPQVHYRDEDDNDGIIVFNKVNWDSKTGELTGDKRAITFLKWAADNKMGEEYGAYPSMYRVENPFTNPSDMAHVLRAHGINLPDELLGYDVEWGFNQQYFEQWETEQEYLARGEKPPQYEF
ncbi:hypothetical protein [Gallibacterium genomosp. 3]|uniref:Uncharacterized protein n=1 Tax=Gallibacterium genomosp. 3 TaxID=505345 RepID=A0A1A7PYF4_9PAST|nr:hypothetical protein [Gallibacterium genomosp. 3]OBX06190.1 hypothetical protein QV07_08905 [Gallibacterium genomosp. 3]